MQYTSHIAAAATTYQNFFISKYRQPIPFDISAKRLAPVEILLHDLSLAQV